MSCAESKKSSDFLKELKKQGTNGCGHSTLLLLNVKAEEKVSGSILMPGGLEK